MTRRLSLLLALVGCTGPTETVVDLAPDPDRTGIDGTLGPYGVAHATLHAQARVTDVVDYEVAWPAKRDGAFDKAARRCPVAVFVHGGLVEADRYRWLVTHLASRGYCVISPAHELDLAIFESDNASVALDDLERRSEAGRSPLGDTLGRDAVVMGHSLGAVVSTFRWVADERFIGVGLLAGWAAAGTPVEDQRGRPSLSLIGSEDRSGEATREAFAQYDRFPAPGWFGVVDGMNHYDWADSPSDANLRGDGVATRPNSETRTDAVRVIDSWMDAWLLDDPDAAARLELREFPNIGDKPVIAMLLVSLGLASDVPSLRLLDGRAAAVDVGTAGLSVAADVGPDVGVVFAPGAWIGGSVGVGKTLIGADRTWGFDGSVAGGVGALLATPGAALTGLGEIRGGARGERGSVTLGLVLPAAIRVDLPAQVVAPVGLELLAGIRLGRTWLGARGQTGVTLQVGGPPAARAIAGGWIRIPLERR